MLIIHFRGLISPCKTTHEPPSAGGHENTVGQPHEQKLRLTEEPV